MCVMRTCDGGLARPVVGRAMLAVLCGAGALLILTPQGVQANDLDDLTAQFYSFVPAAPSLKGSALIPPIWADDREKARAAYRAGDFAAALKYLEDASEDGDLVATWYLGHMYRLGQGVPVDDAKALQYYEVVARAFNPDEGDNRIRRVVIDALVHVAGYYRTGDEVAGIKAWPERAFEIYKLASTYGHPAAQYALGLMYFEGVGVKRNRQQAMRWLMLAARKRFAPAEALLGEMYWQGEYVHRDRTRGLMWYMLAQESAQPEETPEIFDRFDRLMIEASDSERTEAETLAESWSAKFPVQHEATP